MAVLPGHLDELQRIFALPGFLQGPSLTFGVIDLVDSDGHGVSHPWYRHADLAGVLVEQGAGPVETLDLFDARADWRVDMNRPLPNRLAGRFGTVVDLGSLEHVFDTKQCLENLFRMIRVGGHLLLHTPCKGYYDHGFHTFSPECVLMGLADNGFTLRHVSLTTPTGTPLSDPADADDVLLWVVGRKDRDLPFVVPQQKRFRFMNPMSSRPIVD